MEQLRDIKGLAEINTYGFELLIGVMITVCLLALVAWFAWYRFRRGAYQKSTKEEMLTLLQTIDFHDAKRAAYQFTEYGRRVMDENSLHVKQFEAIVQALEAYKYKKEVPPLEPSLQEQMHDFIKEVSHV